MGINEEVENSTNSLLVGGDDTSVAGPINVQAVLVEPVAFSTSTSTRTTLTTTTIRVSTSTNTVADIGATQPRFPSTSEVSATVEDNVLSGADARLNGLCLLIFHGLLVVASFH